ncbi:MAG TPA: DUF4404 family protein [Pseudomonadales bacterium]
MSNDKIRRLLTELHEAMQDVKLDDETRDLAQALDQDIQRLLEQSGEPDLMDQVTEQAREMDARFAAEHPLAERLLREIVDALGRMGI